jgi:DNA topoisomerase-1
MSAANAIQDMPEVPRGLTYVNDTDRGITRHRRGDKFTYRDSSGRTVKDRKTLARIRALAIPPAYEDVWICASANGHIQATGRDARGRKQYRYHAKWREHRDGEKYLHMIEFARSLPVVRERVRKDLGRAGLPREKVAAAIVALLESTLIRVGNDTYARDNKSFGLTTLRDQHIAVNGSELRLQFRGKSGKSWKVKLSDRRVSKVVRACQDLPGQNLFQYVDDDGETRSVTSSDVNDYLRDASGQDITAKDFRTWAGTVLAALALREFEAFDSMTLAKRNIKAAIERVAERLGNTPTICRKCYVHPEIVTTYLDGTLAADLERKAEAEFEAVADLRPEEAAVLALIRRRLGIERNKRAKPSARRGDKLPVQQAA